MINLLLLVVMEYGKDLYKIHKDLLILLEVNIKLINNIQKLCKIY